jgi:hypothetical protein
VEPFEQSSFVLSPKQSSSLMSGYGRGRLLLGSSGSESESERNSDSRRRSDATPYDRQPVPGVSNDNQSVITERRPSRFDRYGNTRRIPLDRVDSSSTVPENNLPGLSIHNQNEYQDYLNRQLNRPTPAAIVNNTSSANNEQPPSYESIFGARRFYTSPAARRETLETKLENLSTKLIVDIQFLMSQYENDKRFLVRRFYANQ